jgi:hypothetical protein
MVNGTRCTEMITKNNLLRLLAGLAMLGVVASAHAMYVVDTGSGPDIIDTPQGLLLEDGARFAGEFSISEAYTISSIEWWGQITNTSTSGGDPLRAVIYADGGDVPGSQLFATTFGTTAVGGGGDFPSHWFGVSGLDWLLDAGTYWVALEHLELTPVINPGTLVPPAADPLDNYAHADFTGSWVADDSLDFAVRISTAVPEPTTLALLSFGLVGLGFTRRRMKA